MNDKKIILRQCGMMKVTLNKYFFLHKPTKICHQNTAGISWDLIVLRMGLSTLLAFEIS